MDLREKVRKIMEEKKITYEELQFLSKVAPDTVDLPHLVIPLYKLVAEF